MQKYTITITPISKKAVFVTCKEANIAQEFLIEDISALFVDMPNLVEAEGEPVEKEKEECNCLKTPLHSRTCKVHYPEVHAKAEQIITETKKEMGIDQPKPSEEADNEKIIEGLDKKYSKPSEESFDELVTEPSEEKMKVYVPICLKEKHGQDEKCYCPKCINCPLHSPSKPDREKIAPLEIHIKDNQTTRITKIIMKIEEILKAHNKEL